MLEDKSGNAAASIADGCLRSEKEEVKWKKIASEPGIFPWHKKPAVLTVLPTQFMICWGMSGLSSQSGKILEIYYLGLEFTYSIHIKHSKLATLAMLPYLKK